MKHATTRLRAARFVVAALALALAAAACGSDEAATTTDQGGTEPAAETPTGHDHGDVIEVPEGMAVPTVDLRIEPDSSSGLNLFVELEDFEINPRNASTGPVDGEGHLHLYVDGERKMRFYNTALHLTGLDEGEHEIAVEVSANNHAAYAIDGAAIRAIQTVTVDAAEAAHSHADSHEVDAAAAPAVAIEAVEDPKSGWNLFIAADGFELTPENVGGDAVDGEGHLHLYVDGVRKDRIYGEAWHLPDLPAGEHKVVVELAANDHAAYAIGGEPIRATATIISTATTADGDHAADGHDDGGMADGDGHDADAEGHDGDDEGHDDGAMADDDGAMAEGDGVVLAATVSGGSVEVDTDRFDVALGEMVTIVVVADQADHIHLHGYDLLADTAPGVPAELQFEATVPGVFEVELEDAGLFLFEIAVAG